jgi:alpha-tubulin suppressor-like RCC1 family protein
MANLATGIPGPTSAQTITGQKKFPLALGYGHSLALGEKGKVWSWGHNQFGQLGFPKRRNFDFSKLVNIDCSAALTENGSLYLWGKGKKGQLGRGKSPKFNPKPIKISPHIG